MTWIGHEHTTVFDAGCFHHVSHVQTQMFRIEALAPVEADLLRNLLKVAGALFLQVGQKTLCLLLLSVSSGEGAVVEVAFVADS